MPFTRQTLCLKTTICESPGCNECSSSLTDSMLALCSTDNWMALISLEPFPDCPNTARESPAFATYSTPLQITPIRQHDPTAAIWGLSSHCFATRERKPSSVAEKALHMASADMPCCSDVNSAQTYAHYQNSFFRFQFVLKWKKETTKKMKKKKKERKKDYTPKKKTAEWMIKRSNQIISRTVQDCKYIKYKFRQWVPQMIISWDT